uniref:Pappalysin-1 n=1 Tax=Lygus hesperus TaxID=30085 RepID=A0A0A9XJF4_LYGHE
MGFRSVVDLCDLNMLVRILVLLSAISLVFGRRCLPFPYRVNGMKCGDNTRVEGTYCGIGKCNIFGTSCQGGCRNVTNLKGLQSNDVIMCTKFGAWKGGLALNETHVLYPAFKKGFTAAIQDLSTATTSYLGEFCRIETKLFDHYARILGYLPRQNITTKYHLGVLSYNWEYQVTWWKYGVAFSPAELAKFLGTFKDFW